MARRARLILGRVYLGRPNKGVQGRPGKRAWKAILVVFQRVLALFGFLWLPGALFIKKDLMETDYFMFSNQETNGSFSFVIVHGIGWSFGIIN